MSKFVTLLVEDDAFQREILADVLKYEGFEVIECTTAESAELIIASTGTELQALITDHNLAGKMSGAELAQYARRRHPHLNVVIISGTTVNPMPFGTAFLQKRFPPERLLESKKVGASLSRDREHTRLQSIPNSLRTVAAELPTLSTAF